MVAVLDSSALVAFLTGEQGWQQVAELLDDQTRTVRMHALNICEVYYDALRRGGEADAEEALRLAAEAGIRIVEDFDATLWKAAARRKAKGRISLADCVALALAERLNADFYTADHHEFDQLVGMDPVKFTFIR